MSIDKDYDYLLKIMVIGDQEVGKSNLIETFYDPSSFKDYPMFDIDYRAKLINFQQKYIKLHIWDPIKTIMSVRWGVNYRGSQGILIVYDCTERTSFDNIKRWMDQVERYAPLNVNVMIVGNKCDLYDKRVIGQVEIDQMLSVIQESYFKKVTHIQVSVKDFINVEHCFIQFSMEIINRLELEKLEKNQKPQRNNKKNLEKKNCKIQ